MIIVRAPMRISIGGGGTDLPSYYSQFEGEWTSAAINKYTYVIINKIFQPVIRLKYSKTEEVSDVSGIQHPIFRESLKLLGIQSGIEIVSMADIPSNTGLGTSSSFAVALLAGLHAFLRNERKEIDVPSWEKIAEEACHVAMNILQEPSGKQDEYIAACGGINTFFANKKGEISTTPLYPTLISEGSLVDLNYNLLLFFTGIRRESKTALSVQANATKSGDDDMIQNLHKTKEIGKEIKTALSNGDFKKFGELMDYHWREKKKRKGTSDLQINEWYELARKNGAIGGKLIGAGGGGFFLFYVENEKEKLRQVMKDAGLTEVFFRFDTEGVKIISDI